MELIWDKPMEIDLRDVDGRTPLTWSVSLCSDKATHWLLTKGADPNALDRDGWTPLHYAACWNNAAVVLDLIHAGARDGMRSQAGETAQEVAIRSGFERVVSALRQARSS